MTEAERARRTEPADAPDARALRDHRQMGLRLRLVLAIGGIMLVAFVPLFLAISWLTTAQVASAQQHAAAAIATAAGRLACADPATASLERLLVATHGAVDGFTVNAADGVELGAAGVQVTAPRHTGSASLTVPCDAGSATVRFRAQEPSSGASTPPELRLLTWYLALFALALLVFLYISMTRLIVRPLDRLVLASEHVAGGALRLEVPRTGTRELDELGRAVQTMTARLRDEEEALHRKVDELTRATARLREARDQVTRSDRLASVGRLAAGLAHEVGNPLAALLGLEDLLLDGDLDPEAQKDFLGRMKKETERIHGVMRDLLDYARTDGPPSTGAEPTPPTDVREVVDDVVRLVTPQKLLRGVELVVDVQPGVVLVALPAARLTQVLLNLVMNAAQAIAAASVSPSNGETVGSGGGAGTAGSAALGRIVVRVHAREAATRIEVEDDGPGVPPELRDRLFEPFVTSKPAGEGTGLGLAVCRALVESSGGTLRCEDAEPHGAVFILDAPAA